MLGPPACFTHPCAAHSRSRPRLPSPADRQASNSRLRAAPRRAPHKSRQFMNCGLWEGQKVTKTGRSHASVLRPSNTVITRPELAAIPLVSRQASS
jgi:hypothetical protein